MTCYLRDGDMFSPANEASLNMHDKLPPGNYIIKQNPQTHAFYFVKIEDFEFKGKIYGDTSRNVDRILQTFFSRPNATGVMLSGEKGSGKSLLSKLLSIEAATQHGVPTIVINNAWTGDDFLALIQGINQPCIVLFDEFEKVYQEYRKQESILTLFDGVFPSKKLFILTINDVQRLDSHMLNRPGRMYYAIDYSGLDPQFVAEYCRDNLKNQAHSDEVGKIASIFAKFNFDMLKALVEEMNRYNEAPYDALKLLNIKPQTDQGGVYAVELSREGKVIEKVQTKQWRGSPLSQQRFQIIISSDDNEYEYDDYDDEDETGPTGHTSPASFTVNDLVEVDRINGKRFIYKNAKGYEVVFTLIPDVKLNFSKIL